MDSDGDKQIDEIQRKTFEKKISYILFVYEQFFSAIWVRCSIFIDNGIDRFVLDYGRNFLPYIGCFFYILYFITKII